MDGWMASLDGWMKWAGGGGEMTERGRKIRRSDGKRMRRRQV